MKNASIIGLLLCLVLVIGTTGCIGAKSSAEETGNGHLTIMEVMKLLKADIAEDIILTYIAKHNLPPDLSADDIIKLQHEGGSPAIISALLGTQPGEPESEFPFNLDERHSVGEPITYGALAVFPVYLAAAERMQEFLTLDAAEELGVVVITEKSGGSVPAVIIRNTSDVSIYICAGEVIFGGKQDRMIAHDVVIAPRETIEVKVRCVESGRWHGTSSQFTSGGLMGSNKVREAVQFMAQSDVWNRVAEQNAQLEAQTSTGTYRAALTHEEIQELYKAFARQILPKLEEENVAGMIIAVNGEILCIDIFGSPALFDDLKEKILKASVLDIIGIEDEGSSPPSKARIMDFYREASRANSEQLQKYQENANNKRESQNALVNESVDDQGQMLHQNIIQK